MLDRIIITPTLLIGNGFKEKDAIYFLEMLRVGVNCCRPVLITIIIEMILSQFITKAL